MNAHTPDQAFADYATQLALAEQAIIDSRQPKVSDNGYDLIASGIEYGGTFLDFYGEYLPGEGHWVKGVALQGQRFDLYHLFTLAQIKEFQFSCDRHNERDDAADKADDREAALEMQRGDY